MKFYSDQFGPQKIMLHYTTDEGDDKPNPREGGVAAGTQY